MPGTKCVIRETPFGPRPRSIVRLPLNLLQRKLLLQKPIGRNLLYLVRIQLFANKGE
jgi:hypothetical protein